MMNITSLQTVICAQRLKLPATIPGSTVLKRLQIKCITS